jgi:hypothetical protein
VPIAADRCREACPRHPQDYNGNSQERFGARGLLSGVPAAQSAWQPAPPGPPLAGYAPCSHSSPSPALFAQVHAYIPTHTLSPPSPCAHTRSPSLPWLRAALSLTPSPQNPPYVCLLVPQRHCRRAAARTCDRAHDGGICQGNAAAMRGAPQPRPLSDSLLSHLPIPQAAAPRSRWARPRARAGAMSRMSLRCVCCVGAPVLVHAWPAPCPGDLAWRRAGMLLVP